MRRSIFALAAAVTFAMSIAAAQAQSLYVPITSYPGDGTVLELVITNPDPELTRVVTGTLFGESVDGVTSPGTAIEQIGVAPKATRVVTVPPGIGLLRLKGYAGLQISARLRVPGLPPVQQGDAVPILGASTVTPANTTVDVQSLIAATGFLSDVGLFNAGSSFAQCEARVSLADGSQVGPLFALNVPPLSFKVFKNVPTGLVGGAQVSSARVTMRCNQSFFLLSRTVNPQTGYVSINTAGEALGSGLPEPGSTPTPTATPTPPPGNSPPAATQLETFTRPGLFYTPSDAVPQLLLELPVTPNVAFSRLAVSFRFKHGGWNATTPDGVMNLAYLTRGVFNGDVFASLTVRGPGRNVVRNEITVDLPSGQKTTKAKTVILNPGTVYDVDYLFDGVGGIWTLTFSEGGSTVLFLSGFTTGPVWTQNRTWTLLLSEAPREGHVPTLGWEYSDLVIEWRP